MTDDGAASSGLTNAGEARSRASIEGVPVSLESHPEVLAGMGHAVAAGRKRLAIAFVNSESLYHARRNPAYRSFLRSAIYGLCDGVGVIIAGWGWGHNISRYNGPLLLLEASQNGVAKGWRHFYYGGKEGIADEMERRLKEKFPGLIVCGTHCPPFRQLTSDETDAVIGQINAARPDIVWVSLGLLKQERWIAEHLARLDTTWAVGVGAAFDYHAGAIPWAPAIVRTLGLEWLFRLIVEPSLRIKRFWWSISAVAAAFLHGVFTLQFLRRPKG